MAFIDYYKILGIAKDTPQEKIKSAYKKRARQFHPDLHPDDPKAKAKFQALTEAFDVLNDPAKRKKYDQYGEHWKEAGAFGGAGGSGGFGGGFGGSAGSFDDFDFSQFSGGGGFSSFFENLFGGGREMHFGGGTNRSAQYTNNSAYYNLNLSVSIDMYTALLGGDIILQTSNGKLKLKVKPETQNGTKVRLKGKGYDKGDGTFGDMIITYDVKLPKHLSERQRELLKQMREG